MRAALTCAALALLSSASWAVPLYVDDDAVPTGTGTDWSSAFASIQDALAWANDPAHAVTEIRVAGGIYTPDVAASNPEGTGDRHATFTLVDGVAIRGGYAGVMAGAGGSPDDRDVDAYPTVLTGDLLGDDGPGFQGRADNCYHVVTAVDAGTATLLDGLVIEGGRADGSFPDERGAGIRIDQADVTINNCVLTGNAAEGSGAAIYNLAGGPTLTACTISGNVADGEGGGVYSSPAAEVVIEACTFTGNAAGGRGGALRFVSAGGVVENSLFEGNSAIEGGAVHLSGSVGPRFRNCALTGNMAALRGGGMFNTAGASPLIAACWFVGNVAGDVGGGMRNISQADPQIVECRFIGNHADTGGGIANWSASPTLLKTVLRDNTARLGGGIYSIDQSDATMTECTFGGNSALSADAGRGGALYNDSSDVSATGCAFMDNAADNGGAIANSLSQPTFTDCVFLRNTAVHLGGGFCSWNASSADVNGCVFRGNTAGVAGGAMANILTSTAAVSDSVSCGNEPNAIEGDWLDEGGNEFTDACPATCPADSTGDGDVNTSDLLVVLYEWGPCQTACLSDVDGDGVVGITELLAILAGWGPCPPQELAGGAGRPAHFDNVEKSRDRVGRRRSRFHAESSRAAKRRRRASR